MGSCFEGYFLLPVRQVFSHRTFNMNRTNISFSLLKYITSKLDINFLDFCLCFKGARITVRNALVAENVSSVRRAFSVLCEVADCIAFGIVLEDIFLWKMMGNHVWGVNLNPFSFFSIKLYQKLPTIFFLSRSAVSSVFFFWIHIIALQFPIKFKGGFPWGTCIGLEEQNLPQCIYSRDHVVE